MMSIKLWVGMVLWSFATVVWGQNLPPSTEAVQVSGRVKTPLVITVSDLLALPSQKIPSTLITSHTGEPRGKARRLRGVSVATVLGKLQLLEEKPKLFSSVYFVFRAADGYQVVFSWNELFNALPDRQVFFVTQQDGRDLAKMAERILIIAPSDLRTGRRYVKGLAEIQVFQVQ